MDIEMNTVTLNNGVEMPQTGYGVYQVSPAECERCVSDALSVGYRMIDTAQAYHNEEGVGNAVRKSGISRQEIFLVSKVWISNYGYEKAKASIDESLRKLQTHYIDLMLLHQPFCDRYGAYRALEEAYKEGKLRAIGVSNFMPHHIELLKAHCEILPMVNQLRLCPGVTQPEVVAYCKKNNILVEAYSPFGTGAIFKVPQMQQLAQKYGQSVGQICLRWSMQMGWLPLPKSANPDRVKENLNVFDFELEPEDVELIANLKGVCGEAPVPDEIHF